MNSNPLVLTFDVGSQSIRGLIFDTKGNLIDKSKIEYPPLISPKPGYWEVEPHVFYDAICEASRNLYESNQDKWDDIIGISITTIRDTPVFLDENYNPVRNAIVWADQRVAKCDYKFPLLARIGMGITGLFPNAYAQAKQTRANWIIENEPENWKKIKHYWLISTYLNYRLTGKGVDSPSYTLGHLPFDFKKKKWMGKHAIKYSIFNIEPEKLPPLVETGSIIGFINEETAKLSNMKMNWPLISSGSDKGCETVGTGACKQGFASISFGTASSIQFTSKKYIEPELFFPAYPAVIPNYYNSEIQIYRGFWMISWFKRQFAQKESRRAYILDSSAEVLLNKSLKTIPPGCHGLIMHPFWGPMLRNPEARGSFIGFTDYHTKEHVYRAIIEGIGFELYNSLLKLEKKTKNKIHTVTVSGGGAQDDEICQINADIFGRTIKKIQTYETSGLGAAIATCVALKVYPTFDEAIENMVRYEKDYTPDPATHELYDKLFNKIYKKVYPRLKKFYKEMPNIINSEIVE
jgi:sugar (pentulose or hexulose) kinase